MEFAIITFLFFFMLFAIPLAILDALLKLGGGGNGK